MPNRRRVAETVAILIHSASSSPRDRSSNGCQPAGLTGHLSLSHFTAGSRKGRRRCSAPHPSPNLTTSSATISHRRRRVRCIEEAGKREWTCFQDGGLRLTTAAQGRGRA